MLATLTEGLCKFAYCNYCRLRTAGPGPMAEDRPLAGRCLAGDPEEVCLRQVGGLQGREIECAMRGMFAAGASVVETDNGDREDMS